MGTINLQPQSDYSTYNNEIKGPFKNNIKNDNKNN